MFCSYFSDNLTQKIRGRVALISFLAAPWLVHTKLFNRLFGWDRLTPRFHHTAFFLFPQCANNKQRRQQFGKIDVICYLGRCDEVDLIIITSDIVANLIALNSAIFQSSDQKFTCVNENWINLTHFNRWGGEEAAIRTAKKNGIQKQKKLFARWRYTCQKKKNERKKNCLRFWKIKRWDQLRAR